MKLTPTALFLFLMAVLIFLFLSIGIVGPTGMSAANSYVVAATMVYVFVLVPIVTIKMITMAWSDVREHILHDGVNKLTKKGRKK